MFRERAKTLEGSMLTLDSLCLACAFGVAGLARVFHEYLPLLNRIPSLEWSAARAVPSDYATLFAASVTVWVLAMRRSGVYRSAHAVKFSRVVLAYVKALVWSLLAAGAAMFALKMTSISRLFFGYYFGSAFLLLSAKQAGVAATFGRIYQSAFNRRHALVIGAGRPASWFAQIVKNAGDNGYDLVGLLLTRKLLSAETVGVPMLGTLEDLDTVLTNYPVDEVFLVGSAGEMAELAPVAQALIQKGRVVSLVSALTTTAEGVRGRVTEFAGVPVLSFGPMPKDEVNSGVKRTLDVTVAAVALAVSLPVMLAIALLIKVVDPGPVLFVQERLGKGGKPFRLFKFRSMRVDAESVLKSDPRLYRRYVENDYKLPEKDDPRISRFGRFLRKSSLDELPQLWNVLRGDMTLVGPRPIVPAEIEKYQPYADLFLAVRPGLTGHWQVNGRSNVPYPERAFMDLDYVGSHSVLSDVTIMARTVPAVLRRKGAF